MNENTHVFYQEVQQFRQPWFWIIILPISALFLYGMIKQLLFGIPFGSNPGSDIFLLIFGIVFGLLLPFLFYRARLITEVRQNGIYVRFFPFHFSFQKIAFDELKGHQVLTYRPIKEYGGWGIRYGSKGKAYNVSGNRGVQLELRSGQRILIGSQQPEELAQAIDQALKYPRS